MFDYVPIIVLFSLCLIIFYQDLKYRGVSWPIFVLLFATTIGLAIVNKVNLIEIILNVSFVSIILATLFLYSFIKRKKVYNILKSDLGLGDILFFYAITPLLYSIWFQYFFVFGLLGSLILFLFFIKGNDNPTIPLAGYLAIFLLFLGCLDLFFDTNFFTIKIHDRIN